ncbi:hypothetical protein YC2023_100320 [Brassica napus]
MEHGVAIRSGHHCAQPLHRYLGVNASARASLFICNTKEDVYSFIFHHLGRRTILLRWNEFKAKKI